jgi:hypothetical protein
VGAHWCSKSPEKCVSRSSSCSGHGDCVPGAGVPGSAPDSCKCDPGMSSLRNLFQFRNIVAGTVSCSHVYHYRRKYYCPPEPHGMGWQRVVSRARVRVRVRVRVRAGACTKHVISKPRSAQTTEKPSRENVADTSIGQGRLLKPADSIVISQPHRGLRHAVRVLRLLWRT